MMSIIPVNYVLIIIAAVVVQIIGALWYSPMLFGKIWMKSNKMDPKNTKEMQQKGMRAMGVNLLVTLVTGYVLTHVIQMSLATFGGTQFNAGLSTAFWMWLGFMAPILLGSVLWESKSISYYAVNAGHYLVAMLAMGAIIGYWM